YCQYCVCLFIEYLFSNEADVLRTFCQATHEIAVPVFAVGYIYAYLIAFACKFQLQIFSEPVKHLKLKFFLWNIILLNVIFYMLNNIMVMCGDRSKMSVRQVVFNQLNKVDINIQFILVSYFFRFFIGTF